MPYSKQKILEIVNHQLLLWIKKDESVKEAVFDLIQTKHPTKRETDDKFDRVLKELANDREAQGKKWEENQKTINVILEEIKTSNRRHDQSMSAIGTRWGIRTEASFRNVLGGILKEINSEYAISHYTEFDSEGIVYGEPNDVEIDVLMKNGNVYLMEISSNITMGDVRTFRDKIKFYEKYHKQKVKQLIIVSPMINDKTRKFALASKMKLYSFAEDVNI